MAINQCVEIVKELGFTELEAQIYVCLVQSSPLTGYKIAKAIGRSNANTYKAIESLEAKGAILIDHGANRLCRAVPVEELLSQLEHRFRENRKSADRLLSQLEAAPEDDRIYRLYTPGQVYERARRILEECEETALLELFPEPLKILREPVERAAARGSRVSVRVYQHAVIEGVNLIVSPTGGETLRNFPFQLMTLFADGSQFLIALLLHGGKEIHQAFWSSSSFIAWSYYTFVFSDFLLSSLLSSLETAATIEELRADYERWRRYYKYPEGDIIGIKRFFDSLKRQYGKDEEKNSGTMPV